MSVIGVRFRSCGAYNYVGTRMATLTDQRIDLSELKGTDTTSRLDAQLSDGGNLDHQLLAAIAHVRTEIALGEVSNDLLVDVATAALRQSEGRLSVADIARDLGVSPRALQRRFSDRVGISPRMLRSIIRFRRVFDVLAETTVNTWTDAAQAAGYFDHPQMAHDFRRFVGCTPTKYLANIGKLSSSLTELRDAAI